MSRTLAVVNQKGGVGKTSCVLALADAARRTHIPTLVVDLDSQANATAAMFDGVPERTTNDLLAIEHPQLRPGSATGIAVPSSWPPDLLSTLDLLPAEGALANREPERPLGYESRLRDCLQGCGDVYDLILIDCPPNLGRLSITALAAADAALLVTEPAAASITGLAHVRRTVELVAANVKGADRLTIAGVVVNKLDPRLNESVFSMGELDSLFPGLILEPAVPVATVIAKAFRAGAPVSAYLPDPAARRICDVYDALLPVILES